MYVNAKAELVTLAPGLRVGSGTRFAHHKMSSNNVKKKHATELSSHIWQLQTKNFDYEIKWEIVNSRAPIQQHLQ